MTFRQANNMIDDISWLYGGESITIDDIVECREICHKALERQIPKKLVEKTLEYDGYYGLCPCCNIVVSESNSFRRCRNCGQALDWSDTV